MVEHPLARVCYDTDDKFHLYWYESLRAMRHPGTWYVADTNRDPGLLASCPYWANEGLTNIPNATLVMLRENYMGTRNCTWEQYFRMQGRKTSAAYPGTNAQGQFLRGLANNQYSEYVYMHQSPLLDYQE